MIDEISNCLRMHPTDGCHCAACVVARLPDPISGEHAIRAANQHIADAIRAAVDAEREACAVTVNGIAEHYRKRADVEAQQGDVDMQATMLSWHGILADARDAIRARKAQP